MFTSNIFNLDPILDVVALKISEKYSTLEVKIAFFFNQSNYSLVKKYINKAYIIITKSRNGVTDLKKFVYKQYQSTVKYYFLIY